MATVTCHTDDCGNAGIPVTLELTYETETGETATITDVWCGACGNPISEVRSDGA